MVIEFVPPTPPLPFLACTAMLLRSSGAAGKSDCKTDRVSHRMPELELAVQARARRSSVLDRGSVLLRATFHTVAHRCTVRWSSKAEIVVNSIIQYPGRGRFAVVGGFFSSSSREDLNLSEYAVYSTAIVSSSHRKLGFGREVSLSLSPVWNYSSFFLFSYTTQIVA